MKFPFTMCINVKSEIESKNIVSHLVQFTTSTMYNVFLTDPFVIRAVLDANIHAIFLFDRRYLDTPNKIHFINQMLHSSKSLNISIIVHCSEELIRGIDYKLFDYFIIGSNSSKLLRENFSKFQFPDLTAEIFARTINVNSTTFVDESRNLVPFSLQCIYF